MSPATRSHEMVLDVILGFGKGFCCVQETMGLFGKMEVVLKSHFKR